MKSASMHSLAALAVFLLTSKVAAMPKAQLAPPPPPPPSDPVCGFDSAVGGADPNDLGSTDLGEGQCFATGPAGTCSRLSLYDTSAVYLCNNIDDPPAIGCDEAEGIAQNIKNFCPHDSGVLGYQDLPEGYRIYLAYGNSACDPSLGPYDQAGC